MVIRNPLLDEHRAKILNKLLEENKVGLVELARILNITETSVRHHISVLLDANIVKLETEGRKTYIKIKENRLAKDAARIFVKLYKSKKK